MCKHCMQNMANCVSLWQAEGDAFCLLKAFPVTVKGTLAFSIDMVL